MNSEGGVGFDWKPQKRQEKSERRKAEVTERRKEKRVKTDRAVDREGS